MIGWVLGCIGNSAKNITSKLGFARWFEHKPQEICSDEAEKVKIFWNVHHQTDERVKHNKPDVVIEDKARNVVTIIDFAVPLDHNIIKTEQIKIERYQALAQEFRRKSSGRYKTKIIPVVVGAFGSIPKNLPQYLEQLGIPDVVGGLQKTALLGTRRILKNTLSL